MARELSMPREFALAKHWEWHSGFHLSNRDCDRVRDLIHRWRESALIPALRLALRLA